VGDVNAVEITHDDANNDIMVDNNIVAVPSNTESSQLLSGGTLMTLHDPALSMNSNDVQQPITEPIELVIIQLTKHIA